MNVEVEIKILDNAFRKGLPYVFEKFYRSEKSRSSHTGGKGIGLAISKSIADLHQGISLYVVTIKKQFYCEITAV